MTAFESDVPSIKVEGTANGLSVKTEPETKLGIADIPVDDDIYEDAGDLDFTRADQQVYLTHLPPWLWEMWSQLDDDEEIQVGTIRIEGTGNDTKRVRLLQHC